MSNNIFIFSGDDEARMRTAAQKIIDGSGCSTDDFSLDIIRDTDESTPLSLLNDTILALQTPSFFGKKTVWLQHFEHFAKEGAASSSNPYTLELWRLAELIKEGLPPEVVFVVDGPGLDARKTFHKAVKGKGEVTLFKKPKVGIGKWEQEIRALIQEKCREFNLQLSYEITDYLCQVIGAHTENIHSEVSKVATLAMSRPQLSLADVQEICQGNASTAFWAFSGALSKRNAREAFSALDSLLQHSKNQEQDSLGLLASAAKEIKTLLSCRLFMQERGLKGPGPINNFCRNFSDPDKARLKEIGLNPNSPFRIKNLFLNSLNYSGPELVAAHDKVTTTWRRMVTSSTSNRLLIEEMALGIISRG